MKDIIAKLLKIDRRIIFLLTSLAILIPIVFYIQMPGLQVTESTKSVYNALDSLPEGSTLLMSFDFDPSTKPELYPMADVMCRHAFKKNIKVLAMAFTAPGVAIAEDLITKDAVEMHKEYGKDYVFLGYQPNYVSALTEFGNDFYSVYPTDSRGTNLQSLPVMQGIRTIKDIGLVMDYTAASYLDAWVAYSSDRYGFKLGAGTTAVNEPSCLPYVQSHQIVGLLGALRGGAEYESLLHYNGLATKGMASVSMGHFLILALIILANLMVLAQKFMKEEEK